MEELIEIPKEFIEEIIDWMTDNDYECGTQGSEIYDRLVKIIEND